MNFQHRKTVQEKYKVPANYTTLYEVADKNDLNSVTYYIELVLSYKISESWVNSG